MTRRLRPLLLALIVAALWGCASDGPEISTAFDPLTPFPQQATFVWDDAANRIPDDPRVQQLDLGPIIKEVTRDALAGRGYIESQTSGNYRVSYQLAVHTWIGGTGSSSIGTLSLQLVEAVSGRRVWMGFGRAEVLVGLTREERKLRLREALDLMLAEFPPTQRGNL